MVDVTGKPIVLRRAVASGKTIGIIKTGGVKKGDPLPVAEVAGMNAAKQTHLLIPHCHHIPLDMVRVEFQIMDGHIEAICTVSAQYRTGVEMEALVGVSMALNTIWDMVKYLEKDENGQYPDTRITDIKVLSKKKG